MYFKAKSYLMLTCLWQQLWPNTWNFVNNNFLYGKMPLKLDIYMKEMSKMYGSVFQTNVKLEGLNYVLRFYFYIVVYSSDTC